MEKRSKELHYKIGEIVNCSGSLQALLTSAIPNALPVEERKEPWGELERYIHEPQTNSGILHGQLIAMSVEAERQVVGVTPGEPNYLLRQVPSPPVSGAKKSEFTEGRLFFAISERHVVLLQSAAVRARAFEEHLQWLLNKRGVISEGQFVQLNNLPPEEVRKHALKGVTGLSIRAPLDATTQQMHGELVFKPEGSMWDAVVSGLEQFGGKLPNDFCLGKDFDPRHVNVKMDIQCKTKFLGQAERLLNTLGNLLRHDESNDVSITLQGGKRLKGNDLKQSQRFSIEHSKKEPIANSVYAAMREYLQQLNQSGNLG